MFKKATALFFMIFFLAGCSVKVHHYKAYEGNITNSNKISTLKVPGDIYIKEIDGKSGYYPKRISDISPYDGARVKLLPGTHTLKVFYQSRNKYNRSYTKPQTLKLDAKPGRSYAIYPVTKHSEEKGENYRYRVSIVFQLVECNSSDELILREKRKKNFGKIYVPMCDETADNPGKS